MSLITININLIKKYNFFFKQTRSFTLCTDNGHLRKIISSIDIGVSLVMNYLDQDKLLSPCTYIVAWKLFGIAIILDRISETSILDSSPLSYIQFMMITKLMVIRNSFVIFKKRVSTIQSVIGYMR